MISLVRAWSTPAYLRFMLRRERERSSTKQLTPTDRSTAWHWTNISLSQATPDPFEWEEDSQVKSAIQCLIAIPTTLAALAYPGGSGENP